MMVRSISMKREKIFKVEVEPLKFALLLPVEPELTVVGSGTVVVGSGIALYTGQ